MKALIILKNAGGTGKTQTLSYLTDLLNAGRDEIMKEMHTNGIDFSAIIKYHGSKVGIITIGDPGTEDFVSYELERLYKDGCDIIIASARTVALPMVCMRCCGNMARTKASLPWRPHHIALTRSTTTHYRTRL